MKHILSLALLLLVALQSSAQQIVVNVEKPGTLSSLIDDNEKYKITDLKITGVINGRDVWFIRDMAGATSVFSILQRIWKP